MLPKISISEIDKQYPAYFSFVISFTPSDKRYLVGIENEFSKLNDENLKARICFFDGSKKGLSDYVGVLNSATLFVGPSTGPLHLSNILGRSLVGIYSPIKVQSIQRWGPWFGEQNNCRVITPEVACAETFECAKSACRHYECMAKIELIKVLKLVKEIIA
ncbi:MAG: glycosyltransferase family 9 protein [Bacteriovoracaceae bacterium]